MGLFGSSGEPRAPADAGELADMELENHEGVVRRLGELWEEGPAVLVFLRHYGCIHCRAHAVQLHRDREKFDAAGARLVVIGQGTPRHAQHFREEYGLDGLEVLVDPDREAYGLAGAKTASLTELVGPRSVVSGLKTAATERMVQGRTQGSATQLGGVLVVAPGDRIAWAHLADHAGDNASSEEVLAAVDEVAAG